MADEPIIFRLDFSNETGSIRSGSNGTTAAFSKGEWHTATAVINMKTCKIKGYLDDALISESTLSVSGVSSVQNLIIPAQGLAFLAPWGDRIVSGGGNLMIDNFEIYEFVEGVEEKLVDNSTLAGLTVPEISYKKYDQAIFDMEILVKEDAEGTLDVCYNNATANGQVLDAGVPELFRLTFAADSDTATLSSNGAEATATLKKGEKHRVATVLDLKTGTVTVYLNGVEVILASIADAANLTLGANTLCFLGAGENVLVDKISVFGMNNTAFAKKIVTIPETDKNGNALNYVLYGVQIVDAATLLVLEKDAYTPVYFDVTAYEDMITTVDAASVRLNDPTDPSAIRTTSGIRFATQINDLELFDGLMEMKKTGKLKDVCFGTLIAPNDYLTEDALTKGLGEGRYLDVEGTYGCYYAFDADPETTHFVGSITNLYTANLGRKFAACGYVEVTLVSGQVITLYGGIARRSIKQVAIGLLGDDSYTWSDDDYAQLDRYSKVPSWMAEELDPTKQKMLEVVNITTGSTETEIYAGEELRSYLAKKGVTTASNGYPIELLIDKSLGDDCYVIEATLGENEKMTITGGNGRGVLYGVYAFLEDYAGFGFYTPEIETFDDRNVIIDAGVMDTYAPVFDTRRNSWYTVSDTTERYQSFYVKNRINGNISIDKLGGGESYAPNMFVHTIGILTETGGTYSGNPCLTNPANLEKTITNVKKILAQNPDTDIISVSQNDNTDYCQCENCAASDAKYGSPAGTMLAFVNAVAEAIETEYPDVIVDTLAYKYTQTAPVGIVPRENVCVRLCSINCHFTQPLTSTASEENVKFSNDIVEWSEICDNIYIWDYTTNYTYCLTTFPNFGVLRENMQFYADHNVKGMFPQGNGFSPSGEFGELRRYLLMRLMADPYMSEEEYYAYMDGFLEAYYGDGWRYIRAYIDKTTELASDTTDMSGIYNTPFHAITRKEWEANRDDFNFYWSEAMRLAGDRLENVQKSHMQWRFVNLCLTPNQADAEAVIADAKKWGMALREGKPYVDPSSDLNTAPWNWKYTA